MTDDLRERVIALADDHTRRHGPVRQHDLALAVAAMVAEECARECDACASEHHPLSLAASVANACAAAIRQRAEGLK